MNNLPISPNYIISIYSLLFYIVFRGMLCIQLQKTLQSLLNVDTANSNKPAASLPAKLCLTTMNKNTRAS